MAGGWTSDSSVNDQINDTVEDAVVRARRSLPQGESLSECEECGEPIPQARRLALPGVRLCVACQSELEKAAKHEGLFNRRASKDSQLR